MHLYAPLAQSTLSLQVQRDIDSGNMRSHCVEGDCVHADRTDRQIPHQHPIWLAPVHAVFGLSKCRTALQSEQQQLITNCVYKCNLDNQGMKRLTESLETSLLAVDVTNEPSLDRGRERGAERMETFGTWNGRYHALNNP